MARATYPRMGFHPKSPVSRQVTRVPSSSRSRAMVPSVIIDPPSTSTR